MAVSESVHRPGATSAGWLLALRASTGDTDQYDISYPTPENPQARRLLGPSTTLFDPATTWPDAPARLLAAQA